MIRKELGDGYPTTININYNWMWGSLAGIFLTIQLITGVLLTMHYSPDINFAFSSIEHIMKDVNAGWLVRYMHTNGASFYFLSIYLHIGRNIYHKLYLNNKYVWYSGLIIFVLSMAIAFIGYVLPWGQMSFWGATVITNLFTAIPIIGQDLTYWLWSGYSIDNATLKKFFTIHFLLPFICLLVVIVHIFFLHKGNSSNPLGISVSDKVPFYPLFVLKDSVGLFVILFIYFIFIFYYPNYLGHSDNYIEANPLVTPKHIVPEWYFLPFYAILRSIPNKLGGVLCMALSILILFFLPTIDFSKRHLMCKNILYSYFTVMFFTNVLLLGFLGSQPITYPYDIFSIFSTIFYFFYIIVLTTHVDIFDKSFAKLKQIFFK